MSSAAGDGVILHHRHLVAHLYRSQPVSHDEYGLATAEVFNGPVNLHLILRVGGGGRLVQNEDGGILQNGAGNGDALTLPTGEA